MDKIDLKPCPFCDGAAELISDDTMTYGFYTPNWVVRCEMEDCIGHDVVPRYSQEEAAIEDWNRRAAPKMIDISVDGGPHSIKVVDYVCADGTIRAYYCGRCDQRLYLPKEDAN